MDLIKQLRASSGAPISDCKKAVDASDGDLDAAFEWLRKKGAARATEKAGRSASQGLVAVSLAPGGGHFVLLEVNSETDFVARNDHFQQFVADVAAAACSLSPPPTADDAAAAATALDVDALLDAPLASGSSGAELPTRDVLAELVGKMGESCVVRRAVALRAPSGDGGAFGSYLHNTVAPTLGSKGALVTLRCDAAAGDDAARATLEAAAKRLAMHVVAARPKYLNPASVPEADVAREREILAEVSRDDKKPPEIMEKIITGKLGKFYAETTLLKQQHLAEEGSPPVEKVLAALGKSLGAPVELCGFAAYHCGED